jgi:hypothetical protein
MKGGRSPVAGVNVGCVTSLTGASLSIAIARARRTAKPCGEGLRKLSMSAL